MAYRDLREYIKALEAKNLIKWVDAEVDKDWEISAVQRVVSTMGDEVRHATGFRNVKGYDIPVVTGVTGGSRGVYATALEIDDLTMDAVLAKWSNAMQNPVPTTVVSEGECQEVVLTGDDVDLYKLPIPTWTYGLDPAPYITAPCEITKDYNTGVQNMGTYRMQVKSKNTTGILWDLPSQHGAVHYAEWEKANEPMPMAVAIGGDPTMMLASVAKAPLGVDELTIAGALRGESMDVVKCKTIDIYVPAHAEIILEGTIEPYFRETEGPFGEYTGYMGGPYDLPVFKISAITHRKNPIYQGFHSQKPPSESSLIRQIPEEANVYKHLVHQLKLPGIIDVHFPEAGGAYAMLWVRMDVKYHGHAKQVLSAAWCHQHSIAKWVVVTDADIDIRDPFSREWALSWRVEPIKDIFFIPDTAAIMLDPSNAPMEVALWDRKSSKVCVDATKKWPYPPIAYPPKDHLDKVKAEWSKYGI